MKLLEAHVRLRLLTALFAFACAFFAVLQMGWLLQVSHELRWVGGAVAFALLLRFFVLRGKKWALAVGSVAVGVWWFFSLGLALRWHELELGFFSLFMLFCFGVLFFWMRSELRVSFLDPQMGWFQGHPRPIARLSSEIQWKGSRKEEQDAEAVIISGGKVSRIDTRGTYLFFQKDEAQKLKMDLEWKIQSLNLTFFFSSQGSKAPQEAHFQARPMSFCERGPVFGVGFEWILPNRDEAQKLVLFLGELRRSGYVSES